MRNPDKFWDKAAEKYAKSPISDPAAYEYTLERTRSYLSPDSTALELGCGTGSTALLLADSAAHILATDYSEGMLAIARRKATAQGIDNVTFRRLAAGEGAGDGPFDVVMAFNLLHLIEDLDGTLAQIAEHTKPGGMFISKSAVKSGSGFSLKFTAMMAVLPIMQAFGKAPFVRIMPAQELEAAIVAAGFTIVETGNHPKGPPAGRYIVARRNG